MIKNLRKRHLQIWLLWAIIFPIAIFFAWKSIPQFPTQILIQNTSSRPLPLVIQEWDRKNYQVQLQTDQLKTIYQLEWRNKTVLLHPTATVYFTRQNPFLADQSMYIGRIEARGLYHFPVNSTYKQWIGATGKIVLYDFIHQQIIDTLNFIQ